MLRRLWLSKNGFIFSNFKDYSHFSWTSRCIKSKRMVYNIRVTQLNISILFVIPNLRRAGKLHGPILYVYQFETLPLCLSRFNDYWSDFWSNLSNLILDCHPSHRLASRHACRNYWYCILFKRSRTYAVARFSKTASLKLSSRWLIDSFIYIDG